VKEHNLADQLRKSAQVNRDIVLPSGQRTYRSWPLCLTCFKEVDSAELVNVNSVSCEILAKCTHKDTSPNARVYEDYYRVKFPTRCDGDPLADERNNWAIKRAMHDFCPFNPEHVLDTSKRR
jgi:hypothetical protein